MNNFSRIITNFYTKFIYATDIIFDLIMFKAILSEWIHRGIHLPSSLPWLFIALLFLLTAIRKFLKKPPIFIPLFKQFRIPLFTLIFSLMMLTKWYELGMLSIYLLIGGLLLMISSVVIFIKNINNYK
tara:strand:+ start:186 stop:569 length:384 start_codon:yes stop_codon:yes gene_type:complete